MARTHEIPDLKLEILGHRKVTVVTKLDDGTREERSMLRIDMQGIEGNKRTKHTRFIDYDELPLFPTGAIVTVSYDIAQQRLPFGRAEVRGAAAAN